jgi:ATP-dependent Lon protease
MNTYSLPVLPLVDDIVLPGMVVPLELDSERQAAVDAARTAQTRVLLVPRPDGRYGSVGVVAEIVQTGRLPGGASAVVVRAVERARIGAGVTGPGAALWVEARTDEPAEADERVRQLAAEYKSVLLSLLQHREAWQVIDAVHRMTDPAQLADSAGYASWLDRQQKTTLLETF